MRRKVYILLSLLFLFVFPSISNSQPDDENYSYSNENYSDDNDYSYQSTSENENSHYDNYSNEEYSKYANNSSDFDDGDEQYSPPPRHYRARSSHHTKNTKTSGYRLPSNISPPGERLVIVDPRVHAWGAYDANGRLVREGLASAGSSWCRDLHRPCHTSVGTFRVISLGDSDCVSTKFPLGRGGAPMPYCMYFNRNQALHGSYELAEANISHGCVRMHVDDAEWLRFNFVHVGTKVIVKPY